MNARILHVELAEAPRDVLVYLVDHGPAHTQVLLRAVVPADAYEPALALARAVGLLVKLGYVHPLTVRGLVTATADGVEAVTRARAVLGDPE